jgi:hypothetical protein
MSDIDGYGYRSDNFYYFSDRITDKIEYFTMRLQTKSSSDFHQKKKKKIMVWYYELWTVTVNSTVQSGKEKISLFRKILFLHGGKFTRRYSFSLNGTHEITDPPISETRRIVSELLRAIWVHRKADSPAKIRRNLWVELPPMKCEIWNENRNFYVITLKFNEDHWAFFFFTFEFASYD